MLPLNLPRTSYSHFASKTDVIVRQKRVGLLWVRRPPVDFSSAQTSRLLLVKLVGPKNNILALLVESCRGLAREWGVDEFPVIGNGTWLWLPERLRCKGKGFGLYLYDNASGQILKQDMTIKCARNAHEDSSTYIYIHIYIYICNHIRTIYEHICSLYHHTWLIHDGYGPYMIVMLLYPPYLIMYSPYKFMDGAYMLIYGPYDPYVYIYIYIYMYIHMCMCM